ncbi:MAG: TRAP transporter substrate-binding protein DctP [Desulfobacterales bacterium]|nr:TRAP transporter substrate-binding protein DctP [Desulfobacterales bacterium]MDD4073537.1 TRAP transporter substrate-binding protein DctP [Desulfobacterales bacterium]MDD4394168.1 TRAP transporter substrate-binding protein DctP [Desulfobacterales bacterium]
MKKLGVVVAIACILCLFGSGPVSAADKVIKITVPAHITPGYKDMYDGVQRFVDRINELGKGEIQAELYHSQSLYKVKEIVPALINGSCEIIFHTSTHTTGSWPEVGGLSLPLLYNDEYEARDKWMIGGEILNLVNQEMGRKYGVRILASGILEGLVICTRDKVITGPDDLKGMKIRGTGKPDADFVKACGGSPTFLSSSELYEAFSRGTIDGLVTYPGTIVARNLDEVLGNLIDMKPMLSAWGYQIYVLNSTFESWPKSVQSVVQTAVYEYDYRYLNEAMDIYKQSIRPRLEKKMKFSSPSAAQMDKFREIARKTYGDWLKTVDRDFGQKFLELNGVTLN